MDARSGDMRFPLREAYVSDDDTYRLCIDGERVTPIGVPDGPVRIRLTPSQASLSAFATTTDRASGDITLYYGALATR